MKYLQRFAFTLVLVSCAFGQQPSVPDAAAQKDSSEKSTFTIEQVMSSPFPTALTAAARGERIAWVFDSKGERNIWTADAPGFAARQVTHYQGDDGQDIFALRLTPDGKTAVFARGSEVSSEGYVANPTSEITEPKQQVWAVEVETGKARLLGDMGCGEEDCEDIQISPNGLMAVWIGAKHHLMIANIAGDKAARQLTELRGEESEPQWSPDGKHIAYSSGRKDHAFIAILDLMPDGIAQRVRYVAPSVDRDFAPRWSPDGKQLVFIRTPGAEAHLPMIPLRTQPWAIWLADAETAQAHELWHSGKDMNDSLPPFARESLKFGFTDMVIFCSEMDGRNHLYSIPTRKGFERKATLLTPGDFDVEDVYLTPNKSAILYTSNEKDIERRHIWQIDVAGGFSSGRWIPMPPEQLTQGKTIEWSPVMLADGFRMVCFGSTATSPAMPYQLMRADARVGQPLERKMIAAEALPKDFPSDQLVEPKLVTFKSEDGLEIHGQLFLPPQLRGDLTRLYHGVPEYPPSPALIFAHGGPPRQMMPGFHYMYYYHNAYAMNQYLASQGYVVLSVNYRLGAMYGRAFREPANSGWRGAFEYKDILAGAKYLQGESYVDKKRIGIWGGSYGGLMVALGLSRNSDIFAAGVDFHGVHDWSVLIAGRNGQDAPDYKEALKLAWESSPVAAAAGWKSPVLFIHGDDDRNVPFQQTVDLVQRLRKQNVEMEQLIFPDEIHDLLLWKSWVNGYKATAEFFGRKLGMGRGSVN